MNRRIEGNDRSCGKFFHLIRKCMIKHKLNMKERYLNESMKMSYYRSEICLKIKEKFNQKKIIIENLIENHNRKLKEEIKDIFITWECHN